MNAQELQDIFRQLPAGSFTIHLVEFTPIEVTHSDFASVSPTGHMLTAWDAQGHFHFIDGHSIIRVTCQPSGTVTAG